MADGDTFAQACAEKYNLQANRPVEPPSLQTWEMWTSEACIVLQAALLLPRFGMHSNFN